MGIKKYINELEDAEKAIQHALLQITDNDEYSFDEKELRLMVDKLHTLQRRAKYNRKHGEMA